MSPPNGVTMQGALAWLQTVEAVGDELPETYEAKRAEWLGAIGADWTGR
jgi:hypothetical protein